MRILFVEDDPMNRRVVRDMLSVAGLEMAEASNAADGLAMIQNEDFDLILMDLRMPGMDGLTAVRNIRQRSDAKATTPVVVVTADNGLDLHERCLESGADGVILKPVAMARLFEEIGRLLAANSKAVA